MISPTPLIAVFCLWVGAVQAHEFWIDPESYQVSAQAEARAAFRVGQQFKGPSYSYIPGRTERFDVVVSGISQPVAGQVGNDPALQLAEPPEGLLVVVHETKTSSLTYSEQAKWEKFRDHKALDTQGIEYPVPFKEAYRRYAKALIAVGDGTGSDAPTGLLTEIVAKANPYTDSLAQGLPVQVLLLGKPRAGAQVEVFERAPDGAVTITLHTTNAEGIAQLPVKSAHAYLVDAVALEPLGDDPEAGPVWYTHWASLTFAVP